MRRLISGVMVRRGSDLVKKSRRGYRTPYPALFVLARRRQALEFEENNKWHLVYGRAKGGSAGFASRKSFDRGNSQHSTCPVLLNEFGRRLV